MFYYPLIYRYLNIHILNIMDLYKSTHNIQYYKFASIVDSLYKASCKIKYKEHKNAFEQEFSTIYDIVKPLYDVTNNFIVTNKTIHKGVICDLFYGKYKKPIIINGIKRKGNFTFDRAPVGFLSATLDNRIKWINKIVFENRTIDIKNVKYRNMKSKWYTKDFAKFIIDLNKLTDNLTNDIRTIIKRANKAAYNEKNEIKKTHIVEYPQGIVFDQNGNPFINVLSNGVISQHRLIIH